MEFKGHFNDIKDKLDAYFREHPGQLENMHEYWLMYTDGKYLNGYFPNHKNMYAEVIFDDNVKYKTWWNTHPNSWYPENDTLVYVEIDDSDEGKESREQRHNIDKIINQLTDEKERLYKEEKTCKINDDKFNVAKLKEYINELKAEYAAFQEAVDEERKFCRQVKEQLLELKGKLPDLNTLAQINTLIDSIEKNSENTIKQYKEVSDTYADTIKKAERSM